MLALQKPSKKYRPAGATSEVNPQSADSLALAGEALCEDAELATPGSFLMSDRFSFLSRLPSFSADRLWRTMIPEAGVLVSMDKHQLFLEIFDVEI